jgi:hypothetical protein
MTVRKLKGSAIQSGTITTTQLSSSVSESISAGGGPKISSLSYPGDDLAANTAGGQTVQINGSGFAANSTVYLNGNAAASVTYNSSSNLIFTTPALSAATYPVYVINPEDGATAIFIPGLEISGEPTWNTSATLPEQGVDDTWNISLSATSDSSVTYALAEGSSLPAGISLAANGLISGTLSSPTEDDTTYNFTVIASDAENQDASRAFSVSVKIGEGVLFANTVLLLHGDGANNQNNNVFLDSSNNNFTITRNGNPTQGSFSPFSQTGWSNYFDGSGDYLVSPSSANAEFNPANGFTVEGWVRPESTGALQFVVSSVQGTGSFESWWFIGITSGGNWRISYGGASAVDTGTAVTFNSWSHVALSSTGTNTKFFLNGVQIGSVNVNQQNANMNLTFGNYSGTTQFVFKGYMSNFRYVKGTALYTSNFTPSTTPLQPIANTSLLTCQSNAIVDKGPNNFAITRNGDVSVQPYSPFAPTAKYSTANVGGSGYFDGSGDHLATPSNEAFNCGTGSFTLEFWFYDDGTSTSFPNIFSSTDWNTGVGGTSIRYNNQGAANKFYIAKFASNSTPNGGSGVNELMKTTNTYASRTWHHVAFVRNGNNFKIYVNGVSDAETTSTVAIDWNLNSAGAKIGGGNWDGANSNIKGYISNLRLVKGTALYTEAFTPSAPLTNIANTSLLCNFTNAGIFDSTAKNVLETVGDAKVSTVQSKFGGSSMYFDGTGDWLNVRSLGIIGTSDFTVEGWFYHIIPTQAAIWWDVATSGYGDTNFSIRSDYIDLFRSIYCSVGGVNTTFTYTNSVVFLNNWVHVALVRSGNSLKLYLNGNASPVTGTLGGAAVNLTNLKIAGAPAPSTGYGWFGGYIDDFRISRFARYTSNFTPPTSAFKDR